jgi:Flp pilus assembly protein TadG
MAKSRLFQKVIRRSRRFLRADRANVGIMFGLAMVPILAVAGSAVDYSRAASDRTEMQSALDTTALMLAKEAPKLSTSELQKKAKDYFLALLKSTEIKNLTVGVTYTNYGGSKVDLSAAGVVDTSFMSVVGIHEMPIATASSATWGNTRLRVALVLDNTGSMASAGKIDALKTATHKLLDQLKQAAIVPEDVYVSIIPFGKDVNVGTPNYTSNWVRWDLWDAANGKCSKTSYTKKSTCTSNGGVWTPAKHNTWNGCLTDRDQNRDANWDDPVVGVTSSLFPAEQYASCPVTVMALSNDWNALSAKVDMMKPVGNTNQTIGLAWGLQSLLANGPLTIPPFGAGYTYETAVVLLTDGLNTENRFTTTQSSIDKRTALACTNAKAQNVTLYTVQVNTDGDPTSAMLQACASTSDKFFLLTNASEIVSTFEAIGTTLSKLRLAL